MIIAFVVYYTRIPLHGSLSCRGEGASVFRGDCELYRRKSILPEGPSMADRAQLRDQTKFDPLEKEMATHSRILPRKPIWTITTKAITT